ncbi:hypothetical protein HDU90_005164 [Geranomyces variabilis]|nr:hypothetical protein HDU90_005164 [Geranomyces variabilis]
MTPAHYAADSSTKMRILCLHGGGVNSAIFASQTAPLLAAMKQIGDVEFIYLDAPYRSRRPYPGIERFWTGPFFSWWKRWQRPAMVEVVFAIEYVLRQARADGPFDGIMGFSQGAALVAEILSCQDKHLLPHERFKFGIMMCGSLAVLDHFPSNWRDSVFSGNTRSVVDAGTRAFAAQAGRVGEPPKGIPFQPEPIDFHTINVTVPTAHIVGCTDPVRHRSENLFAACPDRAWLQYHTLGHEVPQTTEETLAIRAAIMKACDASRFSAAA